MLCDTLQEYMLVKVGFYWNVAVLALLVMACDNLQHS
jgi:hypothetical protein